MPKTTTTTTTTSKTKIQPFEWLTSPESIGIFVRDHVLIQNDNDSNNTCSETDTTTNFNDSRSKPQLRAMHIGCGSSTVGEYLVRELDFAKVVNVDRDRETLDGMAERWFELALAHDKSEEHTTEADAESTGDEKEEEEEAPSITVHTPTTMLLSETDQNASTKHEPMEFWCLDYTSQSLPDSYADSFDLVVDKSTLDCTLCSDCTATASFLIEIYRTLKQDGGVYLLISFHELDLLLPLIEDLPGADWIVDHTTMERQVECLVTNASGGSTRAAPKNDQSATVSATPEPLREGSTARKPLNVLIARRCRNVTGKPSPMAALDFDSVVKHVQDVNDRWFRDEQPLLTEERIADLRNTFRPSSGEPIKENGGDDCDEDDHGGRKAQQSSKFLSLEESYRGIFTDAEREHLTYEHFLEDWDAFCKEREQQHAGQTNQKQGMTFDLALNFLEANQ